MRGLQDKVALVTGSSRGIGRSIALELAHWGCKVAVNYRANEPAAAKVVCHIEDELGSEAVAIQADVSDAEEAQQLVASTLDRFDALDILVNNAGVARDRLLLRMSEEDWNAVLDTSLKGAFHCTKAVQRTFLRQRGGCIVNIGSVVGLAGNAGQANYAAAKAGLIGFTKAVAKELASRSVRANLVAPGFVQTGMTAELPDRIVEEALDRIPLGRLADPDDIARAVAFLASEDASYITGQVLVVDGGMVM